MRIRHPATTAWALVVLVFLPGCAVHYYYTPGSYEIEASRIVPIVTAGTVDVVSIQDPDAERDYVFFEQGLAVWRTDRRQVAQAVADQLARTIMKQGGRVRSPADRTMHITVPRLRATPATWVMVGELSVEVRLDETAARRFQITHKSPGNMWRVMNGAIALAVIEILDDPDIREWLGGKSTEPGSDADRPRSEGAEWGPDS